jgi:hypothetical protein
LLPSQHPLSSCLNIDYVKTAVQTTLSDVTDHTQTPVYSVHYKSKHRSVGQTVTLHGLQLRNRKPHTGRKNKTDPLPGGDRLFPAVKQETGDKKFKYDDQVEKVMTQWVKTKDTD